MLGNGNVTVTVSRKIIAKASGNSSVVNYGKPNLTLNLPKPVMLNFDPNHTFNYKKTTNHENYKTITRPVFYLGRKIYFLTIRVFCGYLLAFNFGAISLECLGRLC
jgi:hypothetical protein